MSLDPAAQRTSLLASVLHLGLPAAGAGRGAGAPPRRIRATSVTGPLDGPSAGTPLSVAQATSEEGLSPSGPTTGEVLVQSAHLEETTLFVAGAWDKSDPSYMRPLRVDRAPRDLTLAG